jgi:hypothetical protein
VGGGTPVCYKGAQKCDVDLYYVSALVDPIIKLSPTTTDCTNELSFLQSNTQNTYTTQQFSSYQDNGPLTGGSGGGTLTAVSLYGIGQIGVSGIHEIGVCLSFKTSNSVYTTSIIVGSISLVGPYWGAEMTYGVQEDEILTIVSGNFVGSSKILLTAYTLPSISTNPCHNAVETGSPIVDTSGTGQFPLGQWTLTTDTDKYLICWKSTAASAGSGVDWVHGSVLKLAGPKTSNYGANPKLCTVGAE